VFDAMRVAFVQNRSKLLRDVPSGPFCGFNRPGAKLDSAMVDAWWAQGTQGGFKNIEDSIEASSETDFRGNLAKLGKRARIFHGSDDQIVPIDAVGRASKSLVPHGLTETHKERLNKDMREFLKAGSERGR
jgi:non-heme chloroperoxidase